MKALARKTFRLTVFSLLVLAFLTNGVAFADSGPPVATYRVTIQNLTSGQPFSPPVAATHRGSLRMFTVGKLASPELEAIAEGGNQVPMFDLLSASGATTQAVDVGMPLTPSGSTAMGFSDAVSFDIQARPGDRLSLAMMLICTNDGIAGLDRAKLPRSGSQIYLLNGYDAGTEDNTEDSLDLVDPCSGLGPVPLAGDPDGNEDAAVDTTPHAPIALHPNIAGSGELSVEAHGWADPVAKVTVTRLGAEASRFRAPLSGAGEVPPVDTPATGKATFRLNKAETALRFSLNVNNIDGVTQAHIHQGAPSENGPVVAFLFGLVDPTGPVDGKLAQGTLTEADLLGPYAGDFAGFVEALRNGDLYVNVHTDTVPSGEIRGQIGAGGR